MKHAKFQLGWFKGYAVPGCRKLPLLIDLTHRPYNNVYIKMLHDDHHAVYCFDCRLSNGLFNRPLDSRQSKQYRRQLLQLRGHILDASVCLCLFNHCERLESTRQVKCTCVEAESFVQIVVDMTTRQRQASPDAVHVCQRESDVVELVQFRRVERIVITVIPFTMLLLLLRLMATSRSHLDQPACAPASSGSVSAVLCVL